MCIAIVGFIDDENTTSLWYARQSPAVLDYHETRRLSCHGLLVVLVATNSTQMTNLKYTTFVHTYY